MGFQQFHRGSLSLRVELYRDRQLAVVEGQEKKEPTQSLDYLCTRIPQQKCAHVNGKIDETKLSISTLRDSHREPNARRATPRMVPIDLKQNCRINGHVERRCVTQVWIQDLVKRVYPTQDFVQLTSTQKSPWLLQLTEKKFHKVQNSNLISNNPRLDSPLWHEPDFVAQIYLMTRLFHPFGMRVLKIKPRCGQNKRWLCGGCKVSFAMWVFKPAGEVHFNCKLVCSFGHQFRCLEGRHM